MNIIEAYIKFNGSLIILISGLSGSGKTKLAKSIERDFKLKFIDIENYCKKDFDKKVEISGGKTIIDWDDINSFDWEKINKTIEENKSKGIVVSGPYFTTDVLTEKIDFHIHIKISKQLLIDTRKEFIESAENKEKYEDIKGMENVIVNQITYPHYLEYLKKSKIDKFINSKDMSQDQIYDESANFLFFKIEQYLEEYNKNVVTNNTQKNTNQENGFKKTPLDDSSKSSSHKLPSSSDVSTIDSDEEIYLGTEYNENLQKNYY